MGSAKGENTKAAKSGKGVKSVKSRPCPDDGIKIDDDNIEITLFENSSNKEAIRCYDTSLVRNMNDIFEFILDFNADLSSWDVSSVIEMAGMFYNATEFNGDVSDWDVSSVADMRSMFDRATEFNGDVSDWDVSSVTDMKGMFAGDFTAT